MADALVPIRRRHGRRAVAAAACAQETLLWAWAHYAWWQVNGAARASCWKDWTLGASQVCMADVPAQHSRMAVAAKAGSRRAHP